MRARMLRVVQMWHDDCVWRQCAPTGQRDDSGVQLAWHAEPCSIQSLAHDGLAPHSFMLMRARARWEAVPGEVRKAVFVSGKY